MSISRHPPGRIGPPPLVAHLDVVRVVVVDLDRQAEILSSQPAERLQQLIAGDGGVALRLDQGDLAVEQLLLGVEHVENSAGADRRLLLHAFRSEEHTSELQSLMRISYAVFCLKKKKIMN